MRKRVMGWTQQELADKLEIKRSLLGAYEESRADPRLNVLKKAATLFNISLDSLLTHDLSQHKIADFPKSILQGEDEDGERLGEQVEPVGGQAGDEEAMEHKDHPASATNSTSKQDLRSEPSREQVPHPQKPQPSAVQAVYLPLSNQVKKGMAYISEESFEEYLENRRNEQWLQQQERVLLPGKDSLHLFRAFEYRQHMLIGSSIENWYGLKKDQSYFYVTSEEMGLAWLREKPEDGQLFVWEQAGDYKEFEPEEMLEIWQPEAQIHFGPIEAEAEVMDNKALTQALRDLQARLDG